MLSDTCKTSTTQKRSLLEQCVIKTEVFFKITGLRIRWCKIENLLVCYYRVQTTNKGKGFPYSLPSVGPRADPGIQAVSPQVTISHPPGGRLPLLSTRPAVTFPATALPPLSIRLYCLVTEAQLAQGCYAAFAPSRIWTHDLLIASPTLYPLRHRATYKPLIGSDIWRIK